MTLPIIAKQIPAEINKHEYKIIDEYAWLRDPNWPNVTDKKIIEYLESENKYFKEFFKPLIAEKNDIFEELKGRIKLTDQSPYTKKDNYFYYSRTEEDKNYPIYCRKYSSIEAKEEIILDVNDIAEGKPYTNVESLSVSYDHKMLAYAVDFTGGEKYILRIYDLENKEYLIDEIKDISSEITWHEDPNMQGIFYSPLNENSRTDKLLFHKLGEDPKKDKVLFHETNNLYFVCISKSASKKYVFIQVRGHNTNEYHVISLQDPTLTPKLLNPRIEGVFYYPEHNGDYFYLLTNLDAKNFKIVRTIIGEIGNYNFTDYIKEDKQAYLSDFSLTKNYLVLNYNVNALPLIKVQDLQTQEFKNINFPDSVYKAFCEGNNFEENDLRVSYSSLGRPHTTFNYDYSLNKLNILKVTEIPSGFNIDDYAVERKWAKDKDGEVEIPISIFYKKSLVKKDGSNPLYLYGYGSYGVSIPPTFKIKAVSLVNKGIIFAIAHIRGGDELGKEWHDSAKFLNKKRTFEDFISAAELLIENQYTSEGNIVIAGGSAGGMLVGAVINERPELYKAAIAHVPFVDVLNTMLDDTLPLTPAEYKEWGNPNDEKYFEYIKSYSPYDNIKPQNYPNLFITAGISDINVGYWEAAKWVARLRATKTDDNIILLKTNMDAGHQGASGRFNHLKQEAEEILFVYKMFNIK